MKNECNENGAMYTITMIKVIVTDFSRVLLFPTDNNYIGGLNVLNNALLQSDPDYDFTKHFRLNNELLDYYSSLKLPVYIFTSETIQEHPAIKDKLEGVFTNIFSAKHMKLNKKDKTAYETIASKLSLQPSEILYIDDDQGNINAAKAAGFHVILYKSNNDVIGKVEL